MPRLRALHFRDVPGVHPDSRFTLGLSANALMGRGEASGRSVLLRWLAAVLSGDFSQTPDVPWTLDCTLVEDGVPLEATFRRAGPGMPVELLRPETEPVVLDDEIRPDQAAARRVYVPALALVEAVGEEGGLRSPVWVPQGLRITRSQTPAAEVARLSLKHVPELSSLWFHLDYERGSILLAPAGEGEAVGAVSFALERDGQESQGIASLTAAQRRLLSLHYFLACQGEVALLDGVMSVVPDEDALKDLLRHLLPGFGGRVAARQSVLGADSSALLYALGLRSAAAVRESTVLCLPVDGGWLWRDMTEDEARRYFQFYEQEFTQIDSLIRLW